MRCFFIKAGHVIAVEYLSAATDEAAIAQSKELFETKGKPAGIEGFEVWDGNRLIYRFPARG